MSPDAAPLADHATELPAPGERYDAVVIGGGAAGLGGAVTLGRSRRSVLVIDGGEPRNAPADGVHNYLTREGTPPAEMLAIGRREVEQCGGEVRPGRVVAAESLGAGFVVTTDLGTRIGARRLLLATGLVDQLPEVAGLRELWGHDVIHCPYCHGWEVRDQAIGVLGSGPMSVHQVLMFRQLSDDVTYFRHTAPPLTVDQTAELAALGVRVIDGEVAALESEAGRLVGARLASGALVERSTMAVGPRFVARTEGVEGLGLTVSAHPMGEWVGTRIEADAGGKTTVPGVFVAGNATDLMAQVIGAADAGVRAAAQINGELIVEDAHAAVAAAVARRPERAGTRA